MYIHNKPFVRHLPACLLLWRSVFFTDTDIKGSMIATSYYVWMYMI